MAQQLRTFHVDTGRKYFSPEEMEDFMTQAAANGYNSMEICIGNCGWRFLLDDMTIETEGKTYGSEAVKAAFRTGNRTYCDSGRNEWTEEEMIRMLAFAGEKGLEIIPLMDSPGHMEATLTAMKELGIRHPSYQGSVSAMDLENPEVTAFVRALMEKYTGWFVDHGCKYINFVADEYGNDVGAVPGFTRLQQQGDESYALFIRYANDMARMIMDKGAAAVMYNDGMYYDQNDRCGLLDPRIICSYWTDGWDGYPLAPAAFIAEKGHAILNTNHEWYYVLGRSEGKPGPHKYSFESAIRGLESVPPEEVYHGEGVPCMGSMVCLWCDEPEMPYDEAEKENLRKMISCRVKK